MKQEWFQIDNAEEISSPGLLVFPQRIEGNIRQALSIAGSTLRFRPHVKTHKMSEIVQMHVELGVTKFKCATIAEAEMAATSGGADIMLAYPPVGPNIHRLITLVQRFPRVRFSTIVDDIQAFESLSEALRNANLTLDAYLDVDCGMHRTGILPGDTAISLYQRMARDHNLRAAGLHAYDGHIHDRDVGEREKRASDAYQGVSQLQKQLEADGLTVPTIVAGGTPTFPFHARRGETECSPGTYVFWDFGYADSMPDLPFEVAAVLLTRVVSKPGPNRLCLDLGHKAVAAESPQPRVKLMALPDAVAITHSEEHLVVETALADKFRVGDALYGIPRHICPTVALYGDVAVVRNGAATERWRVKARERVLTI
jgi:D-serine deaminase-like pyridoxal phosphate-dependent protein